MPKIIEVWRLAVRLEDGTEIVLPRYDYAFDFSGNFAVIEAISIDEESEGAINEYGEEIIPVKYLELASTLRKYCRIEKFIPDKDIAIFLENNFYEAINLISKEKTILCGKDEELPKDFG